MSTVACDPGRLLVLINQCAFPPVKGFAHRAFGIHRLFHSDAVRSIAILSRGESSNGCQRMEPAPLSLAARLALHIGDYAIRLAAMV